MLEQNLADVHRKINNIIESIENGTASSRLSARLADLEQQESTLNYQLESMKEIHPPVLDRERILFLLEQFLISPNERTEDYNRRIIDTFVNRIEITDTEMLIYFNLSEASASEKQKIPSRTVVRLGIIWSEWRESNSRPLEPHSSALPKLRYTRISSSASPTEALATKDIIRIFPGFVNTFLHLFLIFSRKV